MKKKLFLITCFLLLSSLTIFFAYRNIQFSETIKNKEEEVKKLLKELKEQKEKNVANQKDKNEDYQEETDDLPWLFTWIGAVIDLIIPVVVICIAINCNQKLEEKTKEDECGPVTFSLIFIYILLCIVVFPPIFAIKKYKNKSYWERLKLIEKNFLVFIIFGIIFFIMLVSFAKQENNEKKTEV